MRKPNIDSIAFEAEKSAPVETVQVKINNKANFISVLIEFNALLELEHAKVMVKIWMARVGPSTLGLADIFAYKLRRQPRLWLCRSALDKLQDISIDYLRLGCRHPMWKSRIGDELAIFQ